MVLPFLQSLRVSSSIIFTFFCFRILFLFRTQQNGFPWEAVLYILRFNRIGNCKVSGLMSEIYDSLPLLLHHYRCNADGHWCQIGQSGQNIANTNPCNQGFSSFRCLCHGGVPLSCHLLWESQIVVIYCHIFSISDIVNRKKADIRQRWTKFMEPRESILVAAHNSLISEIRKNFL